MAEKKGKKQEEAQKPKRPTKQRRRPNALARPKR